MRSSGDGRRYFVAGRKQNPMGLFSKTMRYKDMVVKMDTSGVTITCRNLVKKMNGDAVAEFVYPLVNELARPLDTPVKP